MDAEQLRGRAVVSVEQAEKLGAIDDLFIDVKNHRVAGVQLQGGVFRGGSTIGWAAIRTIGLDAVMVDNRSATEADIASDAVRFASLRGRKVVTDAGELAGTIDGVEIEPDTGSITCYTVAGMSEGIFRTAPRYQLPSQAIVAVGENLITVNAKVIDFQRAP